MTLKYNKGPALTGPILKLLQTVDCHPSLRKEPLSEDTWKRFRFLRGREKVVSPVCLFCGTVKHVHLWSDSLSWLVSAAFLCWTNN